MRTAKEEFCSFSSFEYQLFIEALGPMLNEMATQGFFLIDQQVA